MDYSSAKWVRPREGDKCNRGSISAATALVCGVAKKAKKKRKTKIPFGPLVLVARASSQRRNFVANSRSRAPKIESRIVH